MGIFRLPAAVAMTFCVAISCNSDPASSIYVASGETVEFALEGRTARIDSLILGDSATLRLTGNGEAALRISFFQAGIGSRLDASGVPGTAGRKGVTPPDSSAVFSDEIQYASNGTVGGKGGNGLELSLRFSEFQASGPVTVDLRGGTGGNGGDGGQGKVFILPDDGGERKYILQGRPGPGGTGGEAGSFEWIMDKKSPEMADPVFEVLTAKGDRGADGFFKGHAVYRLFLPDLSDPAASTGTLGTIGAIDLEAEAHRTNVPDSASGTLDSVYHIRSIAVGKDAEYTLDAVEYLYIDSLFMDDNSTLVFGDVDAVAMVIGKAIVGRNCRFLARGDDGRNGDPGRDAGYKVNVLDVQPVPSVDGGPGEDGADGKSLILRIDWQRFAEKLVIDLSGGRGGNGARGGIGKKVQVFEGLSPQGGPFKTFIVQGGKQGPGGKGGEPGDLFIAGSKDDFTVVRETGEDGREGPISCFHFIDLFVDRDGNQSEMTTSLVCGTSETVDTSVVDPRFDFYSFGRIPVPSVTPYAVRWSEFPEIQQRLQGRDMFAAKDELVRALTSLGYTSIRYYSIGDGIALVTRMEQIDEMGRPVPPPHRWVTDEVYSSGFSLSHMLRSLFVAKEGRYRVVVFVITKKDMATYDYDKAVVRKQHSEQWLNAGLDFIPRGIRLVETFDKYNYYALVYEFVKKGAANSALVIGGQETREHLEGAGLWHSLGSR